MTVGELIDQLSAQDKNHRVVIRGQEGGRDDVLEIQEICIAINVHEPEYYGAHEEIGTHDYMGNRYLYAQKEWAIEIIAGRI